MRIINYTLFMLLPLVPVDTQAMSQVYQVAFQQQLQIIIDKHPRYVWGGSESEERGLDCSGYLFVSAKRAGMPVQRTTSYHMACGDGGWTGTDIVYPCAKELDFIYWTFTETRPNGHVGVLLRSKRGLPAVTHSSQTRGVVVDEIVPKTLGKVSRVRKLTIGDQNGKHPIPKPNNRPFPKQ